MAKIGKNDFDLLFGKQVDFQRHVSRYATLPVDDIHWTSYHVQAMIEELGEFLRADKRWKTHRNTHHDCLNKKEELADIFITAINLAIFSGVNCEQLLDLIGTKIDENIKRVKGE